MKNFIKTNLVTMMYLLVFVLGGLAMVAPQASAATFPCTGVCQVVCTDGHVNSFDVTKSTTDLTSDATDKNGICFGHGGVNTVDGASAVAGSETPPSNCVSDPAAPNGCTPEGQQGNCKSAANGPVACLFDNYINPLISLLSALVGIFVVIGIVTGGIMYTTSAGDPQKAAAAKGRIIKVLIAMVAYMFLYAFLQFIVPGGKL